MKEATGELNMTVITVVAIAAIAGLFYTFVWPIIQTTIRNNTCSTMGEGWTSSETNGNNCVAGNTSNGTTWYCCPPTN